MFKRVMVTVMASALFAVAALAQGDAPMPKASDVIANWPMPSPDDYDYHSIVEQCQRAGDKFLYIGGPGLAGCDGALGFAKANCQPLVLQQADLTVLVGLTIAGFGPALKPRLRGNAVDPGNLAGL